MARSSSATMFICSASSTKRVGAIGPWVRARPSGEGLDRRRPRRCAGRRPAGRPRRSPELRIPRRSSALELGAGDDGLFHRRLEDHDLVASLALAAIHRDVGLSEQLLGVDGLTVDHRHADRGADVEPAPAESQRRSDRLRDVVGGSSPRDRDRTARASRRTRRHRDGLPSRTVDRLLDPPARPPSARRHRPRARARR